MKIAIATFDFWGLVRNGGIGTATYLLAKNFVKLGYEVHVFFAHAHRPDQIEMFRFFQYYYETEGIKLHELRNPDISFDHEHYGPVASYLLYEELRTKSFDTIIFQDMAGLGYYSLLAKKHEVDFHATRLLVLFHGTTRWHRANDSSYPRTFTEMVLSEMEQASLAITEELVCATSYAVSVARAHEPLPAICQIHRGYLPLPESLGLIQSTDFNKPIEFTFFGRLEHRKGLINFLEMAESLKNLYAIGSVKFTLIGSIREIQGINAIDFLDSWQLKTGIKLSIFTDFDSDSALRYLAGHNCIAVIASLAETYGYTFLECLINRIPLVASDIPPFKELAGKLGSQQIAFFSAGSSESLKKTVLSILQDPRELLAGHQAGDSKARSLLTQEITAFWSTLLNGEPKPLNKSQTEKRHATIAIATVFTRDLQSFSEWVTSVCACDPKSVGEVLIFNCSTEVLSQYEEKLRQSGHSVKILASKKPVTPAQAREILLKTIKTEFVFFLDENKFINPQAFTHLLQSKGYQNNDVLVCSPAAYFENSQKRKVRLFFDSPLSLNLPYNFIGDSNSIFKVKTIKKVPGFSVLLSAEPKHQALMKLKSMGYKTDYYPKPLYYYRSEDGTPGDILFSSQTQIARFLSDDVFTNHTPEFLMYIQSLFQKHVEAPNEFPNEFPNPAAPADYENLRVQLQSLKKYFRNDLQLNRRGFIEMLPQASTDKPPLEVTPGNKNFGESATQKKFAFYSFKPTTMLTGESPVFLKAGFNLVTLNLTNPFTLRFEDKTVRIAVSEWNSK